MIEVRKSRDRRAGPRRGLLGSASALAMVGVSLAVAQPASAATLTGLTVTSEQDALGLMATVHTTPADSTTITSLDHYYVEAQNASGQTIAGCDITPADANSGTPCTISPLVAGTAYKLVPTAKSSADESTTLFTGTPLAAGTSTTPMLIGPVSSSVTASATGNSGEVKVEWTPGNNVGGSAVSNYTATAYLGNSAAQGSCTTSDGVTNNCTVKNLVDGANYTFKVVANNANTAANSAATDPTAGGAHATATPGVGSGPVTAVVASVDQATGNAIVSWTPPSDTTGVTYTVDITPTGNSEACAAPAAGATSTTCTNLQPSTTYTVTVKAVKGSVTSTGATATVRPTTAMPPDPATVTAMPADSAIDVSWTAPSTDNGVAVAGYRAIAVLHSAPTVPVSSCTATTGTSCTIPNLTNGQVYDVGVASYGSTGTQSSALGLAAASSVTPAVQPKPSAPTVTTPAQTDITGTSATINWTPAAAVNGAAVQYYTATATKKSSATSASTGSAADASNPSCTAVPPATSCTITGLLPNTQYDVTVVAYASSTSFSTAGTTTITTNSSSTPGGGGMSGPVVTNRDGLSQMFARGGDNNLYTNVRDANGNWGQWSNLGGLIGSEPVAVLNGSGSSARLQVFVLGFADHAVWYKLQNANDAGFGPWTQVDGSRWISRIDLTKNKADGTIELFGRGVDGNLYYSVQTSPTTPGTWQNWVSLGGLIASDPTVVQWDDGTLEVFAVGAGDGQIWHRRQTTPGDNTSWAWWAHVAPSAAQNVSL